MAVPANPSTTPARLSNLSQVLRRHAALPGAAICCALALALRLYRLGAQSLWLDEGSTWAEVTGRTGKGWLALLGELFSANAAYPLYHVLLKAWVGLAGDSEWALRFPSALAGAGAVLVIYLAGFELGWRTTDGGRPTDAVGGRWSVVGGVAALLVASSPFALWQSQDAKVYSLLMLCAALLLWLLLRALRLGTRRSWLELLVVAAASLFVHRLALLALAGALVAIVLVWPVGGRSAWGGRARWLAAIAALACGGVAVYGTVSAVGAESLGGTGHIPAGPASGLWLSLAAFALDRGNIDGWLGVPLVVWAAPALALTLWGTLRLLADARQGRAAAAALLCMLLVPLGLFAAALAFARLFESRYVTVAFPAWAMTLAYPFVNRKTADDGRRTTDDGVSRTKDQRPKTKEERPKPANQALRARLACFGRRSSVVGCLPLVGAVLLVNAAVLLQPQHGLFSGAAVKEQWRDAIAYLAGRTHPDDLVIVHPYYVSPLWDYYAPRVTPDPLPQPVIFPVFAAGDCYGDYSGDVDQIRECIKRRYNEPFFNQQALGKKRALLLIAPDHAKTVDPPKTQAELLREYNKSHRPGEQPPTADDLYGWVGLRFQFSEQQHTWPCGGAKFVGVEIMCQSYPSTYRAGGAGKIPEPATKLDATFGGELHLRGYSLDLLGGAARPGGSLPVTLYWDAAAKPSHDYRMFLHLCYDCAVPPLANADGYPLDGYPPAGRTSTWIVGDPVHDERALALPANLPPGRYTLLLGVYPETDPSEDARLAVSGTSAPVLGGTRLVLGEVTVAPAGGGR